MAWRATILASLLLAVSACNSSTGASNRPTSTTVTTNSVVPWIDSPAKMPSTTTTAAMKGSEFCSPADLSVGAITSAGAAGSTISKIPVINHSSTNCMLPGDPGRITAIGSDGTRSPLRNKPISSSGIFALAPGTTVDFMIQSRDSCDSSGRIRPSKPYSSVELVLSTGVFDLTGLHLLLCDDEIFTAFQQQSGPETPPPGSVSSLVAYPKLPKTVKAGSTLHYVVSLENHTTTVVRLTPCPVYREELYSTSGSMARTTQTLRLNCSSNNAILPGGQVRFAMAIAVPTQIGLAKFSWHIGPEGPYSGSTIEITAS